MRTTRSRLARNITASLIVTVAGCGAPANNAVSSTRPDTASQRALEARSAKFQAAEGALDVKSAVAFWAPDAVVQPAGAPAVIGRPAIQALYGQFFGAMGVTKLEGKSTHIDVSRSGDLAYETGVNHITIHTPKGDLVDVGKYLLVWKKTDGEWYAQALSFTSDAPAPVPAQSVTK